MARLSPGDIMFLTNVNSTFEIRVTELIIYLSVSTHAVIGQFCGPYSPVRPAKI